MLETRAAPTSQKRLAGERALDPASAGSTCLPDCAPGPGASPEATGPPASPRLTGHLFSSRLSASSWTKRDTSRSQVCGWRRSPREPHLSPADPEATGSSRPRPQPLPATTFLSHHVPGSRLPTPPHPPATTSRAQGRPPPPGHHVPGSRPPALPGAGSAHLGDSGPAPSSLVPCCFPGPPGDPGSSRPRALDSHACRVPFAMPGDLVAGSGVDPGLASPHTPHRVPRTSTGHFRGRPALSLLRARLV